MQYYVYILHCADDTLYCGYTTDVERRVREHNGKEGTGARYTSGRRPVTLVYSESFASKSEALRREWEIKQLSRAKKDILIASC